MHTIRAVFTNGVFKPTTAVELPEETQVDFEPRLVDGEQDNDDQHAIFNILSRRYQSGENDVAAKHEDHQP